MWILRYLILATRQRCNTLLDRRTRMNFDPLHGCPMHVCADKAEWDRRGKDQVAQLDNEFRQDIEAYHTETGERRVIAGETIEVRPVMLEKAAVPATQEAPAPEPEVEETILPEAAPETEAAPVHTGDALVSSGVEAQAEAEPGANPAFLDGTKDGFVSGKGAERSETDERSEPAGERSESMKEQENAGDGTGGGQDGQDSSISGLGTETETGGQNQRPLANAAPSTEVTPKTKTKPAGKAGKK